jgi:hypothetical protein
VHRQLDDHAPDPAPAHTAARPPVSRNVPQAPSVFICYRREDAAGSAGWLHSDLERHFGRERVFRDRDMRVGKWVDQLRAAAGACHVMLVVIGQRWTTVTRPGASRPRLDEPGDILRMELETALGRDEVTIVPVLVDGARMPEPAELPASLAALPERQAFPMTDSHWEHDLANLTREIESVLQVEDEPEEEPEDEPEEEPEDEPERWWDRSRWVALAGAASAGLLAAPVSAILANEPLAGSASSIGDLAAARERIAYYAVERGVFWALVGACVLVAWSLVARSERTPTAAGLVGLGVGAIGGLAGGAAFQGLKYLANPQVEVLVRTPAEWLLRAPNVVLPAMLLGWAFAGGTRGLSRAEAAFAGLACGLIAAAVVSLTDLSRWSTLVIEAAVVSAPLVLASRPAPARTG